MQLTNHSSAVHAHINVVRGGRYFADFSCFDDGPGTLTIYPGDREVSLAHSGGALHPSIVIESTGAGEADLWLYSSEPGWFFHNVTVMRIDEGASR